MIEWVIPLAAGTLSGLACRLVATRAIRSAGPGAMRTNVDGRPVPAVLGWGILAGALVGIAATVAGVALDRQLNDCPGASMGLDLCPTLTAFDIRILVLVPGVIFLGMFAAGYWDDRRGDERPRGFSGHLAALRGGAVTGGMVKLVAGAVIGIAVAAIALNGVHPLDFFFLAALCVALTANLINLTDRAPGRALKVFLVIAVPLAVVDSDWRLVGAGAIGAVLAAFLLDLRATAMLGDAGANPLGAILGWGLATALVRSVPALTLVVVVLLGLNLASERWSFSEVIANNRWLARLDHLGRK